MTSTLSATCLAISLASERGTLRLSKCNGRLGEYFSIEDEHGLIEVALTSGEAHKRLRGFNFTDSDGNYWGHCFNNDGERVRVCIPSD